MTCDSRLKLRSAGELDGHALDLVLPEVEPRAFFGTNDLAVTSLCRFKDTLTPEQMRRDIVFRSCDDGNPYREHMVRW
jgi:hypothetical protein